ncbi:hypothetical protein [Streptomyces sp. KR80]|uniref:hypothetical protein n=1 Tax=Streptomyces sp. KR80 TaxID=3457426 RepID=UPI003FD5282D
MSKRQISHARRAAAAVTLAVALTFTLAGCGGDGEDEQKSGSSSSSSKEDGAEEESRAPQEPETVIATLKGQKDISLDLTSAVRDSGGFVTVKGVLKNSGDKDFYGTSFWSGPDLDIKKGAGGSSLGGATLVDKAEKKRYYILRDTENRPLATTGIPVIEAKSETPVYMQFPAPPKSTTEVDFQLPTFASTTLKLTGE